MPSAKEKEAEEMKKIFLDESDENLNNLEKFIKNVEKNHSDSLSLMEIYRILHNFKGVSGTIGIIEFEKFFHTYESLVSLIQEKKVEITQEIIDLFFESMDVISNALGYYRDNKDLTNCFDKISVKINKLKTKDSASGEEASKKGRVKELFRQFGLEEFKPESLVFNETNKKFYSITVWLEAECKLKTARLFVIIKNLGAHGIIAKSVPQFVDLMDGLFKDSFTLYFQSTESAEELEKIVMATDEVSSAKCEELSLEKARTMLQVEEQEKEVEKETAVLESSTQINNVTVELSVLDELLELFGELLIRTKQLDHKLVDLNRTDVKDTLFQMQNFMFGLQDVVLKMQLVPLSIVFRIYPRMIRGLAQREHKKVNLVMQHNDVKVDRKVLNQISEMLNHLLRNGVYHGIEPENDRIAAGKLPEGILSLETKIENNVLIVTVADDGKGVDPGKIAAKALEKGLFSEEELKRMSEKDIINIIFQSNFSTAEAVDLTSGRGLGLAIVKQKVDMLGGSLALETTVGKGTKFIIQLPIARSLIRALLIRSGEQIYSIALDDIQNLSEVPIEEIREINNQEYIIHADQKELLKLYRLERLFKTENKDIVKKSLKIIHIKKGDKNYALAVDEFLRESEIVIKKIDDMPSEVKGIAGAAILDDGTVSLIIDPFSVIT